jgi:hypothetical protein
MRQLILALIPAVLFVGAMAAGGQAAPQPAPDHGPRVQMVAYEPPQGTSGGLPPVSPPADGGDSEAVDAGEAKDAETPTPQPPAASYVQVSRCTDGSGTVAYVTPEGTQISPASGTVAQCAEPLAIIRDGKRYYGCRGGRIILDCDWFVQTIGEETTGGGVVFGDSSIADFSVPDTSAFACEDALVEPSEIAHVGGTVCDIRRLAGNIGQMHGG